MEIRERSFLFPRAKGTGPRTTSETVTFSRAVQRSAVGIIGYSAQFDDGNDHHVGRLTVETRVEADPSDQNSVVVFGTFGLRDWSGEWDDNYSGDIQYVLLVELDPVTPPLPGDSRADLVIVDAEVTQVIQHFRSAQHLDTPNVFPDNSIRLVAEKATAVRLYIDYDRSSGLAPISALTGTLEVESGGTVTTLAPLRTIAPRRDTEIDRGQRDHTLNFVIPEALCVGTVTIRATSRDNSAPTQFSAVFEKTLTFETMPSLPVLAVGIEYTGPDQVAGATAAELAAPPEAEFVTTLALTENLYPVPGVTITNYLTMTYDKETNSDISSGCDKLGELRDAVADMRGDSDDIVYGLYNTGVETGSVGGCGGGGVGVGRVGSQGTAAHEIGHALGRQHAPCDNVTRCADPLNTDSNYPEYSGFDSDSIGEYGFDTAAAQGRVLRPATAHDMMGYSGNRWISPYTYKALMSRVPEEFAGGASGFAAALAASRQSRPEWIKRKLPVLFLRLTVGRDRKVTFREAFHFLSYPRGHGPSRSPFTVELQSEDGSVLRHACLYGDATGCGCGCGCAGDLWPVRIDQAIPFDARARQLLVYECDKVIYEQQIPDPPKIKLDVQGAEDPKQGHLSLSWSGNNDAGTKLCYLVQWFDGLDSWRGCAPRTYDTKASVPKRIFGKQRRIKLRVLGTSGIATGQAEWEGELSRPAPKGGRRPLISLVGVPAKGAGSWPLPSIIRASVMDESGATVRDSLVRWYNDRGVEIGRGRGLDVHNLPIGSHAVYARVLDTGEGDATAQWLFERTRTGEVRVHRGTVKQRDPKE